MAYQRRRVVSSRGSRDLEMFSGSDDDEQEPQIMCDFLELLRSGSDLSFLFSTGNLPPQKGSTSGSRSMGGACEEEHRGEGKEGEKNAVWFACVLWNSKVLEEFKEHEEVKCKLFGTLGLGRMLSISVQEERLSWPGIHLMNWKKPFILVDIISDQFGICGSLPYLRVRETPTANSNTSSNAGMLWDVFISPECKSIGNEMVRKFGEGVKTTVMIWGAFQDTYPQPWADGQDRVFGEIILRSRTSEESTPLSVVIFHHEAISEERRQLIQIAGRRSELWNNFQDGALEYKWVLNSCLDDTSNSLALHAVKYFKTKEEGRTISDSQKKLLMTQDMDLSQSQSEIEDNMDDEDDDLDKTLDSQNASSRPRAVATVSPNRMTTRSMATPPKRGATGSSSKKTPSPSKKSKPASGVPATRIVPNSQPQVEDYDDPNNYRFTELLNEL